MWKRARQLWDVYRHLKAFRDLLEAITLWKLFLVGVSVLTGIAVATLSWLERLPKSLAILIGLTCAALVMALISLGIRTWNEWKGNVVKDKATVEALGQQPPPWLAVAVIGLVAICIAIGVIRGHRIHTAGVPYSGPPISKTQQQTTEDRKKAHGDGDTSTHSTKNITKPATPATNPVPSTQGECPVDRRK
ncbi:MAG TPA: hypothetical protein VIN93_01050 [Bryobacteraceae bacterium]